MRTEWAATGEVPLSERTLADLVAEATRFHGHSCPGQVLGVRMTLAGCREIGLDRPRSAGKGVAVFVEIDRCPADAIQALTGVSVGKRTLKYMDYGKTAATFVDTRTGATVRVAARDDARARAIEWAPASSDPREAQTAAYGMMPEADLLKTERVLIDPGWLDRRRARVSCTRCGEGITYQREVMAEGQIVCRPCAGEGYYSRRWIDLACSIPQRAPGPHDPIPWRV